MNMKDLLDVQLLASDVVKEIYRTTSQFPSIETRGLTSQMRRSAVSIVSNIAEGRARESKKEYIRFVNIAYASGKELEAQIRMAFSVGLLSELNHSQLRAYIDRVLAMLWKLQTQLILP